MSAGNAQIGKLAPDFTAKAVMPDLQFQDLTLSDYRGRTHTHLSAQATLIALSSMELKPIQLRPRMHWNPHAHLHYRRPLVATPVIVSLLWSRRIRDYSNEFIILFWLLFLFDAGKYVVFFFYPLDFTFVCPTEIIAFSEAAEDFRKIGCEVIGASVDSHFSHFAWYTHLSSSPLCNTL